MLLAYYPPLYADSAEELLEQSAVLLRRYVMLLGRYDRDTLESGWSDTVAKHKGQGWPTIQEIASECEYHRPDEGWRKDQGWDAERHPSKARPDYSYQVQLGIMSQAEADRQLAMHDSGPREYRKPTPEDIARVEQMVRAAKRHLTVPDSVRNAEQLEGEAA